MTAFHNLLMGSANISSVQRVGTAISAVTSDGSRLATLSLTGLTGGLDAAPLAGDMVIGIAAVADDANDLALGVGSGYTLIGSELKGPNVGPNLRAAYKVMSGSPDTSITFDLGAVGKPGVVAARVYRGFNPSTPIDVTTTTATGGSNSSKANPPAITPVTPGSLIFSIGAGGSSGSFSAFTSADLSNFSTLLNGLTNLGFGDAAWSGSGSFDPAQFDGGSTNLNDGWAAITLAIRST